MGKHGLGCLICHGVPTYENVRCDARSMYGIVLCISANIGYPPDSSSFLRCVFVNPGFFSRSTYICVGQRRLVEQHTFYRFVPASLTRNIRVVAAPSLSSHRTILGHRRSKIANRECLSVVVVSGHSLSLAPQRRSYSTAAERGTLPTTLGHAPDGTEQQKK